MTKIQWADKTINPIVGCSKISAGCANCYAATQASTARLQQYDRYKKVKDWDGTVEFVPTVLQALEKKKPTRFFVGSMTDIFHINVKDEWLDHLFSEFEDSHHQFMVLTKRSRRMADYFAKYSIYGRGLVNIWAGVSVENQLHCDRLLNLDKIQTAIRFVSFEPLLEEINLNAYDLSNVDWAIIGGESGKNARPCNIEWIRSLVRQLKQRHIKVFVKQLGQNCYWHEHINRVEGNLNFISDRRKDKTALGIKSRKGDRFEEFPKDLQIREIPNE
ncbi:MAG: DUF5131 family protein [Cyanobacteria bacterium P01_G01_bin.49]